MTDQMKEALHKAADGMEWAHGQIVIDKVTLKPQSSITPLENLVCVPIPNKIRTAVLFGANWYLNNVWHDAKTEEPDEGKELILMFYQDNGSRAFRFGLYSCHAQMVMVSNNGGFPWLKLSHYEKWAYIDDLLPYRKNDK